MEVGWYYSRVSKVNPKFNITPHKLIFQVGSSKNIARNQLFEIHQDNHVLLLFYSKKPCFYSLKLIFAIQKTVNTEGPLE